MVGYSWSVRRFRRPPAKALVAYREGRKKVRYHGEALTAEEVARLRALGYAVPEPEED